MSLELERGAVDLWKAPEVVLGAGVGSRGRLWKKGLATSRGGGNLFSSQDARASIEGSVCKSR
jgi:hypothetical protein